MNTSIFFNIEMTGGFPFQCVHLKTYNNISAVMLPTII